MSIPFHKQTDPTKQAGQVVFSPVAPNTQPELYLSDSHKQETTLAQYIERKTDEPKKITFKEWLKKSSFVEPDETVYCWLEDCWNAALTKGKI